MSPRVRVCVTLPAELVERMDDFCYEHVVSRAWLIKTSVEKALPKNGETREEPEPTKWWKKARR